MRGWILSVWFLQGEVRSPQIMATRRGMGSESPHLAHTNLWCVHLTSHQSCKSASSSATNHTCCPFQADQTLKGHEFHSIAFFPLLSKAAVREKHWETLTMDVQDLLLIATETKQMKKANNKSFKIGYLLIHLTMKTLESTFKECG